MPVPSYSDLPPAWQGVINRIAESAEQSDRDGVPRSHFNDLAAIGAHGAPTDTDQWRELTERIAGADASTWFCWTQHQTPLRTLEAGGNQPAAQALQEQWLPGLQSGKYLAAVAFAHIRRPGPANPMAAQVDGDWQLDGSLDWVTSWDIADVVMVMALTADKSDIVTFFIPTAGFTDLISGSMVGEPLDLLSMSGTHTRPIQFEKSVIPSDFVFNVSSFTQWQQADDRKTLAPNPAALGLARAAIDELETIGTARNSPEIMSLVDTLTTKLIALRHNAYSLLDQGDSASAGDLLQSRVEILEFARECTAAVVIARAGAGMQSGKSAERRVRESMFLQVQAQTEPTRNAALTRLNQRYSVKK
jgi:alkylation response protein AidB-like acyl-CoA dehydrogenase